MSHPMRHLLLALALLTGLAAADRPVLVLSGTGQYQPLASGDNYLVRDAANFVLSATTGTKFGTATTQKLAFYNSTPVIQQTGDVATALATYGLIASPTIVATTAVDSTFRVLGSGDATKKMAFEVDAQGSGFVTTIDTGAQTASYSATLPVMTAARTFAMLEQIQTFTATQTFGTIVLDRLHNPKFSLGGVNNVIEAALTTAVIIGGTAGYPSLIGSTGKPVASDFTPTDWADDVGYVAGTANITIIGGGYDHVNNQEAGTICGGGHNFIKYNANGHSFIGGGSYNLVSGARSAIVGGRRSTISGASSVFSFIGAGDDLNIVGSYSAIIGGLDCDVAGGYALAFGRRAKGSASGTVTLADSTDADFTNSTANSFASRYVGGYRFEVASAAAVTLSAAGAAVFPGAVTVPDGSAAAPGIRLTTEAHGLHRVSATALGVSSAGVLTATFSTAALTLASGINVVMSGASSVTAGTGASSFGGNVSVTGGTITLQRTGANPAMQINRIDGFAGGIIARVSAANQFDINNLAETLTMLRVNATAITTGSGVGVVVASTTDATSTTTGSLTTLGGISAAKYITVGGGAGATIRYVAGTANAAVATTLGSVGPTGSTAGDPQGWVRVSINGTDRFIPYW